MAIVGHEDSLENQQGDISVFTESVYDCLLTVEDLGCMFSLTSSSQELGRSSRGESLNTEVVAVARPALQSKVPATAKARATGLRRRAVPLAASEGVASTLGAQPPAIAPPPGLLHHGNMRNQGPND